MKSMDVQSLDLTNDGEWATIAFATGDLSWTIVINHNPFLNQWEYVSTLETRWMLNEVVMTDDHAWVITAFKDGKVRSQ